MKEKIISLFNSTLSIAKIAKLFFCDERTVRRIFVINFGEDAVKNRCKKILNLYHKNNKAEHSKMENKNYEIFKNVIHLFCTNLSLKAIANKFNISTATVANIWKRALGTEQYNKRVKRMRKKNTSVHSSKNEVYCNKLLNNYYKTIHHDYSIVPGLEIDISIPDKKIAISWDGVWHRKVIISESSFYNMQKNDKIRIEHLEKISWRYIIVEDNGKFNPKFVEIKVEEIKELIEKDWQGKVII